MTKTTSNHNHTKLHGVYAENRSMTSVVSFPQRCSLWGDNRFRGNCDGQLFKDLILRYRAKRIADPMMGSGTTRDVVQGLNRVKNLDIEFWGADLSTGFNLVREDLPGSFDFVWVHPPYWTIISYGDHFDDLSNAHEYDDYVRKLHICLKRCHAALIPGGRLAVLVGDVRRFGIYTPIVRDVLNMEDDLGQLRSVIIKTQHNCFSDGKTYNRMEDPPIQHEYCVVFKKR